MNLYGLKVLDFHAHFPIQRSTGGGSSYSKAIVDRYGEEKARIIIGQTARYREEWRHRWGFDPPESGSHTDEEQAVRWIADMDRKGVERVNFVMGGGNDNLARIVKMYPDRFTGFAHHDLFSEDAAVELERAVKELGLRGYKMIASALTRPVDDKAAYPVWEVAERLDIPILIHFGVLGGGGGPARNLHNLDPLSLWEVAASFPTLKFVIPHFGACYLRELLQLCWSCPNVLIDTSGSNQWMAWMPYPLTLRDLFRKAVETVGAERIVFGTDSSYFPRGFSEDYLKEQVRECRAIGLDEGSVEKIFYGNAARLLKLG
ncbi:amidohydrolase family protein [Candidatus Bathyarchaeota archaeon]|jgi:predicted TIM-barrel fold metal-dependent hydrolase|nr:amidohydrolase family protein [Candidatus Bathyarchaeota archaeon]